MPTSRILAEEGSRTVRRRTVIKKKRREGKSVREGESKEKEVEREREGKSRRETEEGLIKGAKRSGVSQVSRQKR